MRKLAIIIVLAMGGCEHSHLVDSEPQLDEKFKLPFDSTFVLEQTGLEISFIRVNEDSRCPADMECDWQYGQVVVLLDLDEGDNGGRLVLGTPNYSNKFSSSANLLGHRVSLLGIEPLPANFGDKIPEKDYIALMWVIKE